jgi:serine/threonine protein kinase
MVGNKESGVTPESDVMIGSTVAKRYKLLGLLGEGDRKRTYLAQDTALNRKVALALIKGGDERGPSRTMQEWQALAQAGNNDNIVTLHDRGTSEGTDYMVFVYLAGGTLREHLKKRADKDTPFSADEIMRLGRQLARALSHLHKSGLIHRDVAPANVWLDERGEARLGDFDSAIGRDTAPDCEPWPVTTEGYAAPEQVAGGQATERSDLYSLGAVLYEAATFQRPPGTGATETAKSFATFRPDLPRKLGTIIRRLLELSPEGRPASAEEVVNALRPARNPLDSDEAWISTLPFPLASILWLYLAEPEPGAKVDFLLKFFEGLAQFAATVQLSACKSDPSVFDKYKADWFNADPEGHGLLDLRRATFGTWVELSKRLAATGRHMLADHAEEAERYLRLFSASDTELVEALTSKELNRILAHACNRRNQWSGHGGVAGPRQHSERLLELEKLLSQARSLFTWSFVTWTMLKPGTMTLSHGVFNLTAIDLTGTNAAFRKKQVKLSHPLDDGSLYILNDGSAQALALEPLIRIIPDHNTGEDACYFYNRLEGDKVRWVSYHYRGKPELMLPDPDVVKCLSSLTP